MEKKKEVLKPVGESFKGKKFKCLMDLHWQGKPKVEHNLVFKKGEVYECTHSEHNDEGGISLVLGPDSNRVTERNPEVSEEHFHYNWVQHFQLVQE